MENSEGRIHQDCYVWFHNSFPELRGLLCYNLNNSRNGIDGARNRSKGVQAGRADFAFYYKGKTVMIEMKEGRGKQSQEQKQWQQAIEQQGFRYFVCRDIEEFQEVIGCIIKNGSVDLFETVKQG